VLQHCSPVCTDRCHDWFSTLCLYHAENVLLDEIFHLYAIKLYMVCQKVKSYCFEKIMLKSVPVKLVLSDLSVTRILVAVSYKYIIF